MSIIVTRRDGVEILRMTGDFTIGRHFGHLKDLQGRPLDDLRQTIDDLLSRGQARIVLDLERVKFIDSAGLGELVACRKLAVALGGDIRILHAGQQVEKVLVLTLLTEVFELFHDEEAAVRSFAHS